MKTTISTTKEVEITHLQVSAEVRYWEDAEVNGLEDVTGSLIPFKYGDLWRPSINVETGIITDWPKGTVANVHYKVCDAGRYYLNDANGDCVASIEDDYVPGCLCPKENGYGDYIILNIDDDGKIDGWQFNADHVKEFETNQHLNRNIMAKQKTPLGDILDYLDRVEGRDIHTLSIAKLRERVKERVHTEKKAMIKFAKKAVVMDESTWEDIFDEVFESNAKPEDAEEDGEPRQVPTANGGTREAYSEHDGGDIGFSNLNPDLSNEE